MAYSKTIWKDRVVEKPRNYRLTNNSDGTITLIPAPGTVTEQGTPITAKAMNKIEQGIYDNEVSLKGLINESLNGESGYFKDKKTGHIQQYGVFRHGGADAGKDYIATITMPTPFPNTITTLIPTMYRCEKADGSVVIANIKFKGYMIYNKKNSIGIRFSADDYVEGSVLIAWQATGY